MALETNPGQVCLVLDACSDGQQQDMVKPMLIDDISPVSGALTHVGGHEFPGESGHDVARWCQWMLSDVRAPRIHSRRRGGNQLQHLS